MAYTWIRAGRGWPGWFGCLATAVASCRLLASDTAFDSLAFVPDPGPGPTVTLPEHPALNWTRVVFSPRATNDFPEQLHPLETIACPVDQVSGLAGDAEQLWVVSRTTNRVYHRPFKVGAEWSSFVLPVEQPTSLACDGRQLWVAGAPSNTLCALDLDGKLRQSWTLSFPPGALLPMEGQLLISDWQKDAFHRLDPANGRELGVEPAPDNRLTGLARVGRYLWCSRGDEILCFDRERGLPVCGFCGALDYSRGAAVVGLCAAADSFWYANPVANQILRIRRPGHGEWVAGGGRVREAAFDMVYHNPDAVPALTVLQHVPFLEMPGQRYLTLKIEPAPRAFFRDDLGNVAALLEFGSVAAGQNPRCTIATTMWVADRRMVCEPDQVGAAGESPARAAYTARFHPIAGEDSPEVRAFVEAAVGGETNAYWRVRRVHDALCRTIYYREPADESVPGVLRQGYGVCRNYSAAMESFGRLLGVPILNAWVPHHETCFLMLPGLSPSILEVTANGSGPNPASTWRRSRWFLGTSADEITTGARGYAMHSPLWLDDAPFRYGWHCWLPSAVPGLHSEGWWSLADPQTHQRHRL